MRNLFFLLFSIWTLINSQAQAQGLDMSVFNFQQAQFQDMGSLESPNARLETDLAHLLPERYDLGLKQRSPKELRQFQKMVTLSILATPTGSRLCGILTGGEPTLISQVFGLSLEDSFLSPEFCITSEDSPFMAIEHHQQLNNQRRQSYFRGQAPSRTFEFVLYDDSKPEWFPLVQSWTTASNRTYVFVGAKDLRPEFFYRVWIHELAMMTDLEPKPFGEMQALSCHQLAVSRNSLTLMTFRTLRAVDLETKILREMGINAAKDTRPCLTRAYEMMFFLSPVQFLSTVQDLDFNEVHKKTCSGKELPRELFQASHLIHRIHAIPGLCEKLLVPDFRNTVDSPYSRGPRPNIGTGTVPTGNQQEERMNFQGSNRPPGIRTNEQIKSDLMILPMNGQQKPKPNPANGQPRVTKDLLEGL
jgi:hypothetical protein